MGQRVTVWGSAPLRYAELSSFAPPPLCSPCHGSHYDGSGRIRRGPAPLNLEVPEYKFIPGTSKVLLG